MRWISEVRERLRGLFFRAAADEEAEAELRFHIDMEAERLEREGGLEPQEARRRAAVALGGVEKYREKVRDARGLAWVSGMSLDFRLGIRMLLKYPGLTVVGGLAIAFAIWVGAGTFEFVTQVMYPRLPLPDGDRIVGITNHDASRNREHFQALHDFAVWREELTSVDDVGAFRTLQRNLIVGRGRAEPVEVAEISASAFNVARVRPLHGRVLIDADEHPGSPAVAVIGHRVWQTRFDGDPEVVGRVVRLGTTPTTIVGVMPEKFEFPVAQNFWIPLQLDPLMYDRGAGPSIRVFGRRAPGATLEQAQTELTALGRRLAADFPQTNEHLRPQVLPFPKSILNISGIEAGMLWSSNVFLVLLLVLICGNVSLLMFARAATRENEIVVRNALGASRRRIVAQFFIEALVLGGLAAMLALSAAGFGLRWAFNIVEGAILDGVRMPFWFHPSLSPATIAYAVLLTLGGAVIAGVLPGFKMTRGLQARLRESSSGGGGPSFGGIWTVIIVAQIAVTTVFPVSVFMVHRDVREMKAIDYGFPEEEYLAARVEMDRESAPGAADTSAAEFGARFRRTYEELERRIEADASVAGVTFANRLPRMYHPHRLIELDAGPSAPMPEEWPGYRVSSTTVDPGFFETLPAPIISGRGFFPADLASAGVVVVNQAFVDRVMGGRNPIGRRVRYTYFEENEPDPDAPPGPWHEIVGVIKTLGRETGYDPKVARLYHPGGPDAAYPLQMAIRVKGDPGAYVPRLRELATAVDPALRLYDPLPLDRLDQVEFEFMGFWLRLTGLLSVIALLLSLAGIYSVMSFTVARRTREIGIRVALGASARRIVLSIFRRPLTQVATGILVGAIFAGALGYAASGTLTVRAGFVLLLYALLMMGVCLLACIVPTRRALMVEPTEALRADG